MSELAPQRRPGVVLRVRYVKVGKVRFTGHRDVVRMWERALRRSGLPVAWSEGFSPRPLISFGLALPTGAESLAEYLDVVLSEPPDAAGSGHGGECGEGGDGACRDVSGLPGSLRRHPELATMLSALLPPGIDVEVVSDLAVGTGSLQREVSSCSWDLEVLGLAAEELARRVERLLAAPSLLVRRERKGRAVVDDLRPAILALAVTAPTDPVAGEPSRERVGLYAELATQPRGVRPRELLSGLGDDVSLARARRIHQWIERDGARWEPLESGPRPVATMAHATERAS